MDFHYFFTNQIISSVRYHYSFIFLIFLFLFFIVIFIFLQSLKSTVADRSKWAEILFETFRAPSICIGNSSSLTMFASGRTTGIAVECGAGVTSSVPVFEGLALSHAAVYSDFGGQDITTNLRQNLMDNNFQILHSDTKLLKEKHCFIKRNTFSQEKNNLESSGPESTMESFFLPDGEEVSVSRNGKKMLSFFIPN